MASLLTGTTIAANIALHAGNYNSYALPLSGGTLASTNDQILTLNKSSGTGWGYIGFSQAGTRRFYFGLNGSFEPELGVDNGGTFRVVGGMTVAGNAVLTSTSTLTAGNLSGTIPSGVLGNSTHYIGTTAITLNRASASQTLTGVSIDGNAANITAYTINQNVGSSNSPTFVTLQLTRLNFGATGAAPYLSASGEGFGNGITFGGDENSAAYRIFTGMENIGGNYSKLTFNWHTGIRIGAYTGYGGIRFYNNVIGSGTEIFSVGNTDNNVRVVNSLIVNGITINQERATNARMYGATTGTFGLLGVDSAGSFRWQIYGDGSNYGFLDSTWGNWDIQKAVNGQLDLRVSGATVRVLNAGNYQNYALPLTGGTLTGALNGTTASFSGNVKGGRVTLRDDCLEQHVDDSDSVGIFVNYFGYNSGTTRFRNFGVFNGKNQQLLYITGSTGATAITGTLAVSSAITQGGSQVLHAGNVATYALPIGGGTLTGPIYTSVGGTSIFIGNQNVTTSNGLRINFHTDADLSYYIGKKAGAWTQPLDINFYTGIRLYASSSYDYGISFWNSNNTTKMMSVGEGDSNVRVVNTLYIGGNTALHTANYNSYALPLSGGTLTGGLSGTTGTFSGTLNASGNVGIGTTTNTFTLNVYNNADVWHARFGSATGELRIGGQTSSGAVIQSYTPAGAVRDLYIQRDGGNLGVGTIDFSYTINDNTRVVGSNTNNKLFVNGSIQLLGNNDAIVFGRGTSTFLTDEELGFGWGGGWYMTDETYLRVRNNKLLYSTGEIWASAFKDSNNNAYYLDPANSGTSLLVAGNVGIGTTTAFSKTTISKAGVSLPTTADSTNNAHLTLAGSNSLVRLQFGTQNVAPYGGWIQASYDNTAGDNGTEPILLNPLGGNVGIGATTPAYKLDVNGTGRFSGDLTVTGALNGAALNGTTGFFSSDLSIVGQHQIRNANPTITFRDTNNRTAYIHVNGDIFYVLTAVADSAYGSWGQVANSRWPLELNLSTNNAVFGADVNAISFTGSGSGLTGTAASLTAGAVPWSGITSKPTTLAGFGITDALPLSGGSMTGYIIGAVSGLWNTYNSGSFTAYGNATNPALISFHRPNYFATNLGLDTDGVMKIGGWSLGGPWPILHSNNFNTYALPLSGGTLTGGLSGTTGTFSGTLTASGDLTILNLIGSYQNTSVYNSANTLSTTPSRGIRAQSSSIQFTDSYAIAPFYTYRTTGDWPVPYGIGWGTGGESSGIFQRYAANGYSFGDMIFYTGNDSYGAFSFRRHTWEGTTYFAAGSHHLDTELFRVDWSGNLTMLGTLNGSANSATLYPNNGSYGSWKIGGTKGGWYGLEFESGSIVMANSAEVGFYRVSYGWQFWWSNGTAYCMKGSPGGGTQAVILDSSNVASYALPIGGGTLTGSIQLPAGGYIGLNGASTYGIGVLASNRGSGVFDTLESTGSDPLELNYYQGGPVKIGSGANGSKALYAVGIYDNGNQVLHAGNYGGYSAFSGAISGTELTLSGQGMGAYNLMKYSGLRSGDWQTFTNTEGQLNVIQVNAISSGAHTNYPTGVYTYGAVMSWRTTNHSFQLYASHTGDLAYKTQWQNDNYSGWRRILDSTNYPYAAAMNQNVGTSNSPTFASLVITSEITIQKNNARNLLVKGAGGADCGILGLGSGDQFAFQLYGNNNSEYGFLNSAWGGWDLRKVPSGSLFLNGNVTYYLNPASATNLYSLTVANTISGSITGNAGGSSASCTGNAASASYANEIIITYLSTATVSINNGRTAIYRNENGLGAALAYSPVLHAGAGDTMWQVQGTYGSSGNGTFYFRQGYQGVFGNWLTMLSSANYSSYALPLSGGTLTGALSGTTASFSGVVDATQFRDSNNVAYYLDPASTSILNRINLNTAATAYMQWRSAGQGTMGGGFPFYNNVSYGSINIEVSDNDTGGLVIDNEGVTVYGAGDNGEVFRVIDEDVYQSNSNITLSRTFWINQGLNGGGGILGPFSISGTATASSFTGAGTGLTGTAASLTIGGNAANVTGTVAIANGGTGATTAAAARTNLGIPNSYLYAKRTTNQTIASGVWAYIDIIFSTNSASSGIAYNTSTGVASLTAGKVYRITAGLEWNRYASANSFSVGWNLCNNADNSVISPEIYSASSTWYLNSSNNPTLDMILAPSSNIDVKIRTINNNGYGTDLVLAGNNYFIIQQIA